MIFKEVKIESFAGIKNKNIILKDGINILYGVNEAGKSSIQAFIKVMLFGMNSSRSKDIKQNDRIKYKPFTGELIRGELIINYKKRDIVIKRIFGTTKKDDVCKVYYKETGENVDGVNLEEPGKTFLGISKNTFEKTLFIGQLAISINKDKEDELFEKISNVLSSGDENISIGKALEKLLAIKKKLITTRKTGDLDNLKDKLLKLNEEKYEAYRLSKDNIDKEESLINLTKERQETRNEIDNLEIYKKYLKKLKLQKEYEDISGYLKKSEELKEKQRFIDTELNVGTQEINEELINDIKDENALYLRMLDILEEETTVYEENKSKLEIKRIENQVYFKLEDDYGDFNTKTKLSLEKLKSIRSGLERFKNINIKIEELKTILKEKKISIGDAYKLKENDKEIRDLLHEYEYKLRELQINANKYSSNEKDKKVLSKLIRQRDTYRNISIVLLILSIGLNLIFNFKPVILIPTIVGNVVAVYLYIRVFIEVKSRQLNKSEELYISEIHNDIRKIEENLMKFKEKLNVKTYEEFIQELKVFDEFISFEEKINTQIQELESMMSYGEYKKLQEEEKQLQEFIRNILTTLKANSIRELINKIDEFPTIKQEILSLELQVVKDKESISRIKEELSIREERIKDKLSQIGLEWSKLEDLEENLQRLKEKIMQKRDIQKALESIEETYSALTKGKDMAFIEEDLKGFISREINYSYETEDEIDLQIRKLSNNLIDIEKKVTDIENDIKNRFIGKREISEIEEEIQQIKEDILKKEDTLKASEIALNILQESKEEMRESFGRKLNEDIIYKFSKFTNNKYKEAFLSDNYDILVKDDKEIFNAELLSNGANDQLYLALRLSFIDILFENEDISIMLDDAFVQYDDYRLEKVIKEIISMNYNQVLIFTCQKREKEILNQNNIVFNDISISERLI